MHTVETGSLLVTEVKTASSLHARQFIPIQRLYPLNKGKSNVHLTHKSEQGVSLTDVNIWLPKGKGSWGRINYEFGLTRYKLHTTI